MLTNFLLRRCKEKLKNAIHLPVKKNCEVSYFKETLRHFFSFRVTESDVQNFKLFLKYRLIAICFSNIKITIKNA